MMPGCQPSRHEYPTDFYALIGILHGTEQEGDLHAVAVRHFLQGTPSDGQYARDSRVRPVLAGGTRCDGQRHDHDQPEFR